MYKGAVSEARRKFPALNIPDDVIMVKLGYSQEKNMLISNILFIFGWILVGMFPLTFVVATIGGAVLCCLFNNSSDYSNA